MPSADRANVVYHDLHGCHNGYFEVLFAFVLGLVSLRRKECAIGFQKNILTLSYPMVHRVRMAAVTVLGRKFEPISTTVQRWSSLTCLPCAYIIHGSVVKSKTA